MLRIYPRCMFPGLRLSTAAGIEAGHPPLLILHGDEDEVVDQKHAQRLAKAAGLNTRLVVLPGARHKDVHLRKDWLKAVSEFLTWLETGIQSDKTALKGERSDRHSV